jgi:hypothetical protein
MSLQAALFSCYFALLVLFYSLNRVLSYGAWFLATEVESHLLKSGQRAGLKFLERLFNYSASSRKNNDDCALHASNTSNIVGRRMGMSHSIALQAQGLPT